MPLLIVCARSRYLAPSARPSTEFMDRTRLAAVTGSRAQRLFFVGRGHEAVEALAEDQPFLAQEVQRLDGVRIGVARLPAPDRPSRLSPDCHNSFAQGLAGLQSLVDEAASALRTAAEEAVDHAAAAGADVAAAVGRELLQHRARRHQHPLAVDQRAPLALVGEVGARRPAVAFDAGDGAVAAGVAGARLLQLLVPVMVLGMALAMRAVLSDGRR